MVTTAALLDDAFTRIESAAAAALGNLSRDELAERPGGNNSIAWLVWHLARVQDDHIADACGGAQAWVAEGWHERFDLPVPVEDTGYGYTSEQVDSVVASADLLAGYLRAVTERTRRYVATLRDEDLDRIVDERWNPPVSLAVRLVSVIADGLQHAGQAAYVRGIVTSRGGH